MILKMLNIPRTTTNSPSSRFIEIVMNEISGRSILTVFLDIRWNNFRLELEAGFIGFGVIFYFDRLVLRDRFGIVIGYV